MENKEYAQLVGSNDAPFINQLAAQYTVVDHAYAITHPSLPNYLALLAGDTFGITSDCTTCFVQGPNLVDSLEARGRSWKAYMEDMPSPCFTGTSAGGYALKHNPFLYFQNIRNNPGRCERIVPLSQLDQDFASGSVPDFVWISPNLIHAMHDASIGTGDTWLATFVPRLLASAAWQRGGTLIVTWDEGTTEAGCCELAAGGNVLTLVIQPRTTAGGRLTQPVTHYSTLRTHDHRILARATSRAGMQVMDWSSDLLADSGLERHDHVEVAGEIPEKLPNDTVAQRSLSFAAMPIRAGDAAETVDITSLTPQGIVAIYGVGIVDSSGAIHQLFGRLIRSRMRLSGGHRRRCDRCARTWPRRYRQAAG